MQKLANQPVTLLLSFVHLMKRAIYDASVSMRIAIQINFADIRLKYRDALLGVLWEVLTLVATTSAFAILHAADVLRSTNQGVSYVAYLMVGILVWRVLWESVEAIPQKFRSMRSSLMKLAFPKEAIIFSSVISLLMRTIGRLVSLSALFYIFGIAELSFSISFVLALLCLSLLGISFALILSPVYLFSDDVKRAVNFLFSFGIFLTPVFYPTQTKPWVQEIVQSNPLSSIIEFARSSFLGMEIENSGTLMGWFAVVVPLFLMCWIFFRVTFPKSIERLGN